jgi:hypothetical protein
MLTVAGVQAMLVAWKPTLPYTELAMAKKRKDKDTEPLPVEENLETTDDEPTPDPTDTPESEPEPVLESESAPVPAEKPVEPDPGDGKPKVTLAVFLAAGSAKWDQMAGFKSYAKRMKLGPKTIKQWREAHKAFMTAPMK